MPGQANNDWFHDCSNPYTINELTGVIDLEVMKKNLSPFRTSVYFYFHYIYSYMYHRYKIENFCYEIHFKQIICLFKKIPVFQFISDHFRFPNWLLYVTAYIVYRYNFISARYKMNAL